MPNLDVAHNATLHYQDTEGQGRPLVLIHGWPLSGASFDLNVPRLVDAGLRVITYDRRGFGESSPGDAEVSYDLLTDDLAALVEHLDLRDAVVLGLSMGGGEAARYVGGKGKGRVAGVVFSSAVIPMLEKTDDNPNGGMTREELEQTAQAFENDPEGFLETFTANFFGNESGPQVSDEYAQESLRVARQADVKTAATCIRLWGDDFRQDCANIEVPALLMHGDEDQSVPMQPSSEQAVKIIPNARLHIISGGTHGANVTSQQEWEDELLGFIDSL